jgi:Zn-dependent M28 family amino/carboxypeptidase
MSDKFYSASTSLAQEFKVEEYRHWSPRSQSYASADVLQQYLRAGWQLAETVTAESFTLGAGRRVSLYHFVLSKMVASCTCPSSPVRSSCAPLWIAT